MDNTNNTTDTTTNKPTKTTVADVLADRYIKSLESGEVPWHKPWIAFDLCNGISKRPYSGFNCVMLGCFGTDTFYFTAKQVLSLGGTVPTGRQGIPISFVKRMAKKDNKDESYMMFRYYTVYPANKCSIPEDKWKRPTSKGCDFSPIERAEQIVALNKCPTTFGSQRACYIPARHQMEMPSPDAFKSPEHYYATYFHEIGHSLKGQTEWEREKEYFADSYSKEELVAEIFSSICLNACGIQSDKLFEQSSAYIGCWLKRLKNDKTLIIKAASEAYKRWVKLNGIKEDEEEGGE